MQTGTPEKITPKILELCSRIAPGSRPVFIDITGEESCFPGECFENVRQRVLARGGHIQFGWSIWEWPDVYIEAEHHAVLRLDSGILIDPTPHTNDGIHKRLFLPDSKAIYDFENPGILRDNYRLALRNDPLIKSLFQLAAERTEILNSIPGVGCVQTDAATKARLTSNELQQGGVTIEIARKYTQRNSPCFCGSGIKFKRCHGRS